MCKLLLTVVLLAAPCFAAAIGDWQALDTKLEENMHHVHDEAKEDLAGPRAVVTKTRSSTRCTV